MRVCIASLLRESAEAQQNDAKYWARRIGDTYNIATDFEDPFVLRTLYRILSFFPPKLCDKCGINRVSIRDDMGPNRPYYPNHGYFIDHSVTLNKDIFYHPDDSSDFRMSQGEYLTRPEQTVIHEFGHGYDEYTGFPSHKPDWLKLSGWSENQKPGLKRMVIREKGIPERKGEYFYDPKSEFTRFYAKMNPWDDFADSFAFYVGGLKDKVPSSKREYMDRIIGPFYS